MTNPRFGKEFIELSAVEHRTIVTHDYTRKSKIENKFDKHNITVAASFESTIKAKGKKSITENSARSNVLASVGKVR